MSFVRYRFRVHRLVHERVLNLLVNDSVISINTTKIKWVRIRIGV